MNYTSEGEYNYDIRNNEELSELEDKYQEIVKNLEVEVYYDPLSNKLKVDSNAEDLVFSNDYLYDKEELKKANETLIVDVPDTNSNDYLYLIGLLFIILSIIYVKRRLI